MSAAAVRERCARIMVAAEAGRTPHFSWHEDKLDACADYVLGVMRKRFPDLDVPIHSRRRHFEAGGIDRWGELVAQRGLSGPEHAAERARIGIDLTIPSVLLDAGAGASWEYYDEAHHKGFSRSEGLGVASFDMFVNGAFATDKSEPLCSDAAALMQVAIDDVERGFQVDANNPLVGVEGRVKLLRRLGAVACINPDVFGAPARLGHLYDYLAAHAVDGKIPATLLLETLLHALGPVWPGRLAIGGVDLGDCWKHPCAAIDASDPTDGLVPFHKLTQWLAYSLLEPLADGGLEVTGLDQLTGLPEYRNGGLLIDFGVIAARDADLYTQALAVDHPAIVEWRALTVIGLDRLAERLRAKLGLDAAAMPLARVLEGGTWTAGRKIAAERRPGGAPPLNIVSDGTVF
ncbi:MAG: URC4/urg3 family protein [Rudaea sp.]|uniref:URC4/urg3 family protein n=1 Tax=Rudaea sp. TaxID=2136325 RepID=UPI0039E459EC